MCFFYVLQSLTKLYIRFLLCYYNVRCTIALLVVYYILLYVYYMLLYVTIVYYSSKYMLKVCANICFTNTSKMLRTDQQVYEQIQIYAEQNKTIMLIKQEQHFVCFNTSLVLRTNITYYEQIQTVAKTIDHFEK